MDNNISRRERKKIETRSNILRAARHLFEENGFDNTTIEEITEKADVSKGTFFNYFSTKESLMTGIADEEVDDILYLFEYELKDEKQSINKLKLIMRHMLEDAIKYLHLTGRVLFYSIITTEQYPSPFFKINKLLEDIVNEGQRKGEITASFSASDIATSIFGCYYGVIFKWFELSCKAGAESELDSVLDIIFKSITK